MLFIDTSRKEGFVALIEEGEVLEFFSVSSDALVLRIQKMKFNAIAVGCGPGSHTGVRIGVTVAKSLAFGLKAPLYSFPSPLGYIPIEEGRFAAIVEAKNGTLFTFKGEMTKKYFKPLAPDAEVDIIITEDIPSLQKRLQGPGAWTWLNPAPNPNPLPFMVQEGVAITYLN